MATKGGKGGNHDDHDQVIEFTPDAGFDIRFMAKQLADMMIDKELPVLMHLAHVSVEFEPGCTPQEIIDGYKQAMAHKVKIKHSNANDEDKPPKKPKK